MSWLLLALTLCAQLPGQRTPATQKPPAPQGTAVVRGRVVDKATGAPMPRAVVALRSAGTGVAQQNVADDKGLFTFSRLPAGTYDLRATAGEYRFTHLPAVYTASGSEGPAPLELRDGEERSDIVLALPLALAIGGRVVDDEGHPLANVSVMARPAGNDNAAPPSRPRLTDDRGMFRVHGVAPGRYRLCADARAGAVFALPTARRSRFVNTCYPNATDPADSRDVIVADAEIEGVEIRLQRLDTYVIKGSVLSADGSVPSDAVIGLNRLEKNRTSGTSTRLEPGGTFTISNVVPGSYELDVRSGRAARGFSLNPSERDPEWTSIRLDISTMDIEGIVLQTRKAATLKGRVLFEDALDASPAEPVTIEARPAESAGSRPQSSAVRVAADGTFTLNGLFGALILGTSGPLPKGYVLKSVSYRGRDVTTVPTEFSGDPAHEAQIVLTNRTSELSGRVLDEKGTTLEAAWVICFPVDPARWRLFGRTQRTAASSGPDGYRLGPLVEGEYLVVAVRTQDFKLLSLPDDYERLAPVAERITILERERRPADLRVVTVPEKR